MTGKPRQQRPSSPGKTALNRHLYHHHEKTTLKGDLSQRLAAHDDLHWLARKDNHDVGHEHLPYQEGESDNAMACRLLAEGNEAHGTTVEVPDLNPEPQE